MKKPFSTILMIGLIILTGCETRVIVPDYEPPLVPRGVFAEAGDNYNEIFWQENTDADIAGYKIYVRTETMARYSFLGVTTTNYFVDDGIPNGVTYYYGVTAYDFNGNESSLSFEIGIATPRPEGYDVMIKNYRSYPGYSGYDFSTNTIGRYDDIYTDVYFENYEGICYLVVWDDTEIQDMGYTNSLYEIGKSPARGWSPTGDEVAIPGHTYIIRTWDNHYAKIRILELSSSSVRFDWAYQLQTGNPYLKYTSDGVRSSLKRARGERAE